MGNCGSSLDCTRCYNITGADGCDSEVTVDSDIAGIGVSILHCEIWIEVDGLKILISFLLSAAVTCFAIFWGYVSDSLPNYVLTSVDRAVILRYQRSFLASKVFPVVGRFRKTLLHFLFWPLKRSGRNRSDHTEAATGSCMSREERVEALARFLLALSDQQLITGIAVIVAAFANRCSITLLEFRIVGSFAWFSATTHLATLEVLRGYMHSHPFVRNLRVFGILVFMGLLSILQIINAAPVEFALAAHHPSIPLQCMFRKSSWMTHRQTHNGIDTYTMLSILLFTMGTYIQRIIVLYIAPKENRQIVEDIRETVATLILFPWKFLGKVSDDECQQMIHSISIEINDLKYHILGPGYANTYLAYLPQITFVLIFGVAQTVQQTWFIYRITRSNQILGFGQVVALALLALPALVAAEAYNDARQSMCLEESRWASLERVQSVTIAVRELRDDQRNQIEHEQDADRNPNDPSTPAGTTEDVPPATVFKTMCVFMVDIVLTIYAGGSTGGLNPGDSEMSMGAMLLFVVLRSFFALQHLGFACYVAIRITHQLFKNSVSSRTTKIAHQVHTSQDETVLPQENAPGISGLLSRPASLPHGGEEFTAPARQDTEADIALVSLSQRQTI